MGIGYRGSENPKLSGNFDNKWHTDKRQKRRKDMIIMQKFVHRAINTGQSVTCTRLILLTSQLGAHHTSLVVGLFVCVQSFGQTVCSTTDRIHHCVHCWPVFCLLLGVGSVCARPIIGQVTEGLWLAEHSLSLLRAKERKRAQLCMSNGVDRSAHLSYDLSISNVS